jgi:predicted TPR repeat methyltransferase
MNSEAERFRFATTSRLILNHFGRSKKLLEIGCGEGHQSEKLANVCDKLFDVSRRAVERAARRGTRGLFAVGDVFTVGLPTALKTKPMPVETI